MTRRFVWITAAVLTLAFSTPTFAQRGRDSAPPTGGGERRGGPPGGREGNGKSPRPEVQAAQERLQQDVTKSKRLQDELKAAKDRKDRDKVQQLQKELKDVQAQIKTDRENLKNRQQGH